MKFNKNATRDDNENEQLSLYIRNYENSSGRKSLTKFRTRRRWSNTRIHEASEGTGVWGARQQILENSFSEKTGVEKEESSGRRGRERDREAGEKRGKKKWNSRMIDVSSMNTNDPARPVNHDEELSDMPMNKDAPRTSAGQLHLIEPAESNWHDPIIYRLYDPCMFPFSTGRLFPLPVSLIHPAETRKETSPMSMT